MSVASFILCGASRFSSPSYDAIASRAFVVTDAATLEADIAAAMAARGVTGFTPASLALHTQAVLQGAFILAKADGGSDLAVESLGHLRRYIELLFGASPATQGKPG